MHKPSKPYLNGFETEVKSTLPVINEDSMPGELSNVIAGRRVASNAFDLCGPNFTVDAASREFLMAAIQAAVNHCRATISTCVWGEPIGQWAFPRTQKFAR